MSLLLASGLLASASAAYQPVGAVFNGGTYLSRGGAWTGVSDSAAITAAFGYRPLGSNSDQHILSCAAGTAARFAICRGADGRVYVFARNASGTTVIDTPGTAVLTAGQQYLILISFNLAVANSMRMYVDDVSSWIGTGTFTTGQTVAFSSTNNTVGRHAGQDSLYLNAEITDLWARWGTFTEFNTEAERRKFFTADNKVRNKGSDGSLLFGAVPQLFLSGPIGSWHTNDGSGGDTTVAAGSLSASSNPPPGE